MSEDLEKFNKDPRTPCKYSDKCYQRNEEHTKKFKHPPKGGTSSTPSPPRKMARLTPHTTPTNRKELTENTNPPRRHSSPTDKRRHTLTPKGRHTPTASPSIKESPSSVVDCSDVIKHSVPDDIKTFIKEKFLVEMPEDFYSFWEFCKSIAKNGDVKNVFKPVNLFLVGPFDVLLENLPQRENNDDYLIHWRYYYDPPEFQTILMSQDNAGYHMGYFRDSPSETPCFVASNEAEKSCKVTPVAENIFGAVLVFLENAKKKSPFVSVACHKLITQLKDWATKYNFTLETLTANMKKRKIVVVTNSFHGAGVVVPYEKKTQLGYRPLTETDATLKNLMKKVADDKDEKEKALEELQNVINYANIATDECDFGGGLELGINLFCHGDEVFHTSAKQLLSVAYNLLNRPEFERIFNAHLCHRRKGSKLSCANL